jgi:hypothetical protein
MLEETKGIIRETVRKILVECLKKEKVCARFIPHFLTPDHNIKALPRLLNSLK